MKTLISEMLLILVLALCMSLLYNMLSPGGLRILPKKKAPVPSAFSAVRYPGALA